MKSRFVVKELKQEAIEDPKLSLIDKLLLIKIYELQGSTHPIQGCYANNHHFAKKIFGVSRRTISRAMSNLAACGYVKAEVCEGKRRLFVIKGIDDRLSSL